MRYSPSAKELLALWLVMLAFAIAAGCIAFVRTLARTIRERFASSAAG